MPAARPSLPLIWPRRAGAASPMSEPRGWAARLSLAKEYSRENWQRLALTGGLLVVFFGNSGFRSLVGNWLELRRLDRQLAALRVQEKDESARLQDFKTGNQSLERLARRELGYIKKGEIEYRFPPPDPKAP